LPGPVKKLTNKSFPFFFLPFSRSRGSGRRSRWHTYAQGALWHSRAQSQLYMERMRQQCRGCAGIHMRKVPCGTTEPRASIEPSREGAGPRPSAVRLVAPASLVS
jgi:hypothetical protein